MYLSCPNYLSGMSEECRGMILGCLPCPRYLHEIFALNSYDDGQFWDWILALGAYIIHFLENHLWNIFARGPEIASLGTTTYYRNEKYILWVGLFCFQLKPS